MKVQVAIAIAVGTAVNFLSTNYSKVKVLTKVA
jgi:hypothetical protein